MSAAGVEHLPPQARHARGSARNPGDRRYASITAAGLSERSACGRASATTSASRVDAKTVDSEPRIDVTGVMMIHGLSHDTSGFTVSALLFVDSHG